MKHGTCEGTSWPFDIPSNPDDDSLEWRLRYAPESLSRSDFMAAASILAAYKALTAGMFPRDKLRRARAALRSLAPTGGK